MKITLRVVLGCPGRGGWSAEKVVDVAFTPSMDIEFQLPGLNPRKPAHIGYSEQEDVFSVSFGILELSQPDRESVADRLEDADWKISGRLPATQI